MTKVDKAEEDGSIQNLKREIILRPTFFMVATVLENPGKSWNLGEKFPGPGKSLNLGHGP